MTNITDLGLWKEAAQRQKTLSVTAVTSEGALLDGEIRTVNFSQIGQLKHDIAMISLKKRGEIQPYVGITAVPAKELGLADSGMVPYAFQKTTSVPSDAKAIQSLSGIFKVKSGAEEGLTVEGKIFRAGDGSDDLYSTEVVIDAPEDKMDRIGEEYMSRGQRVTNIRLEPKVA
jgi:hypothetical protein